MGIVCECNDYMVNGEDYKEISASAFNLISILATILLFGFFGYKREN